MAKNTGSVERRFANGRMPCEVCEEMCLDAVDGTLTAAEQAAFELHVAGCVGCSEQMAEAQRGAAWMEMLKGHTPEPPKHLLQRILALTSEAQASEAERSRVFADGVFVEGVPTPRFRNVVPTAGWRERFWRQIELTFGLNSSGASFQPRMAMTAAMAFFSISLTLNMSGIRLVDLSPSMIHRTVADARANATRSFQNLRMVYQVESRLDDLKGASRDDAPVQASPFGQPTPEQNPVPQSAPQDVKPQEKQAPPPNGTSLLGVPAKSQPVVVDKQAAARADAPRMQEGA